MIDPLRILMRKEWRQLLRSKGALMTSLLLPVLFFVVIPGAQMVAVRLGRQANPTPPPLPPHTPVPPGMAHLTEPGGLLRFMLPMMMTIGGLIVPSVAAMYTVLSEREQRTLELLVALPVRVEQVLWAKLLVILRMALLICGTLFLVDAVALVAFNLASLAFVLALALVLLSALAYSTASALLITLLAKDYRTANNLTGALIVPTVFVTVFMISFVPGEVLHTVALGVALLGCAAVATYVSMRVVTFERLMR